MIKNESIRTENKISKFTLGNEILLNESQQYAIAKEGNNSNLNPVEKLQKSESSWSLETNISSYNQQNEEIFSEENIEVLEIPIAPEQLESEWCTKENFQDTLNEILFELDLNPYSDLEIKENYAIFQENSPEKFIHGIFSIENSKSLSVDDDKVLIIKFLREKLAKTSL